MYKKNHTEILSSMYREFLRNFMMKKRCGQQKLSEYFQSLVFYKKN